jgi:hypothetical protein
MIQSEAMPARLPSIGVPSRARPRRWLPRLIVSTLAVLWLVHACSADVVDLLLPAFRAEVTALDDNLSIGSLQQIRDGPNQVIRMRANLRRPVYIEGQVIYPRGWLPGTAGGYQVYLDTIGVLQGPAVLLIVVLSWPQRSWRELSMRLAIAASLLLLLLSLDSPAELLGNFQHAVLRPVGGGSGLFAWSRFLEGGGNCALALAFAGASIALADRHSRPADVSRSSRTLP